MRASDVDDWIQKARRFAANIEPASLIGTLDLTTLDDLDDVPRVESLCARAAAHNVAAVCIYPRFVPTAARLLESTPVRVATVAVDFPHGQAPVSVEANGVETSVAAGADEIDIVIRRGDAMAGDYSRVHDQVVALVEAAGDKLVKVILETCQFPDPKAIYDVSRHALDGGAHFLKTSTGKAEAGASAEAVAALCLAARDHEAASGHPAGIKPSGGIRTVGDAALYAALAHEIVGIPVGDSERFRLGASSLLQVLLDARAV